MIALELNCKTPQPLLTTYRERVLRAKYSMFSVTGSKVQQYDESLQIEL